MLSWSKRQNKCKNMNPFSVIAYECFLSFLSPCPSPCFDCCAGIWYIAKVIPLFWKTSKGFCAHARLACFRNSSSQNWSTMSRNTFTDLETCSYYIRRNHQFLWENCLFSALFFQFLNFQRIWVTSMLVFLRTLKWTRKKSPTRQTRHSLVKLGR
jgi:hypothetical protein